MRITPKHRLIVGTTAAIALTAVTIIGESSQGSRSWAQGQPNQLPELAFPEKPLPKVVNGHKKLIDEVWGIVNQSYIDPTFNNQDWRTVRQQYLNRDYASKQEVYQAIQQMLKQLGDPFTRFIEPLEFKLLQVDSTKDTVGVGVQLTQDKKTKELVVVSPIEDTPAFAAGVLPQDVLVKIDGRGTQGMQPSEAATRLQGQVGTPVILTVRRGLKELMFKITRIPIEIHAVRYRHQKISRGAIGYIRLTQFSSNAAAEMRQAIEVLERQQVVGYILDLRSNPGGLFSSITEVAQMWLQKGTIVSTIGRQGEIAYEKANRKALTDKPLVILVNEGTASGSEILAAASQENQRAILVGTKTKGYNSIQSVRSLSDGSGLATTKYKWLTPKKRDIDNSGLTPDVIVSLTQAQQQAMIQKRTAGTPADPQYAKALEQLTQLIQRNASQKDRLDLSG